MTIRSVFAISVVLLASQIAFGQPAADEEAAKLREQQRAKLVERVATDAQQLKLPENRALISARLGVIEAKIDRERARKFFEASIANLIAAQQEAESSRGKAGTFYDLLHSQSTRPHIILMIASVDAQFALDGLYRSRPAAVANALAGGSPSKKIDHSRQNYPHIAQAEINLEQRILRLAADQNPERAMTILTDSIKKRLSGETYDSLKKVYLLDAEVATELADDVLERLNSARFIESDQPVYDVIQLATSIATDHIRERKPNEKYLTFSDTRVRTLAIKLLKTYIENPLRIGYIPVDQLEPLASRYDPDAIERLRTAARSTRGGWNSRSLRQNPEYSELMKSNPTADQLVRASNRFEPEMLPSLYQNAAAKYVEEGQYQAAVQLLNEKFDGEALENALSSLESSYANHLMSKGEIDAAEALTSSFGESNRIPALISLAQHMFNRSPEENRTRAAGLLRRIRSMLPDQPEVHNEMQQLFNLINATAPIEPTDALRELESLVEPLNTIIRAFGIVQGFQGGQMRHGEYLMLNGSSFGVHIDPNMFRNLARHDFDRTNSIIDSFDRPELKIVLRMYIAENL